MKLPFNLSFGKKEKPKYFLALLLGEEKVNAVIFEELDQKIKVIGEHEEIFPESIETISEKGLLESLDKAISQAESNLPENIQTTDTIFGVKENWVEESRIKKPYLIKLKKVKEALGLTPLGFLVLYEAIAHSLQEEEGAPVSAILAEVGIREIALSILRAGRAIETQRAKIEDSYVKTIDKMLHRFTNCEILPSRIIIYNGREDEEIAQEFIAHQWSKTLPFLHVPQVTILPKGFSAKAVLHGAASQLGFEVLQEQEEKEEPIEKGELLTKKAKTETSLKDRPETETQEPMDNFGFVKDKDIATLHHKTITKEPEKDGEEIEEESLETAKVSESLSEKQITKTESKEKIKTANVFSFLISIKDILRNLAGKIQSMIGSINLPSGGKKMIFLPPLVVLFLIILFLVYIFNLKANITLSIRPKTIELGKELIFSAKDKTDFSKNTIALETVDLTQKGDLSTPTTGKKEIGEKAKGTVTVYNSSLTEGKSIAKGTTLTSGNNIQFLTDNSVTIASASGDASSITSSTAKVNVTAKEIGKEGNLPSGTKFTISSLSQAIVVAKNESPFSGGNKKEITVVAKEDLDKLLNDLPKKLEDKSKEQLSTKSTATAVVLPIFLNKNIENKEFNKNVGDEASAVSLKASVLYQGVLYQKSDIESFSLSLMTKGGENLLPSKESLAYELKDLKPKDSTVLATLKAKAFLLPKIDSQELKKKLAGKSVKEAKEIILKIPQVHDAVFNFSPRIPFVPEIMPRSANNINIATKING